MISSFFIPPPNPEMEILFSPITISVSHIHITVQLQKQGHLFFYTPASLDILITLVSHSLHGICWNKIIKWKITMDLWTILTWQMLKFLDATFLNKGLLKYQTCYFRGKPFCAWRHDYQSGDTGGSCSSLSNSTSGSCIQVPSAFLIQPFL